MGWQWHQLDHMQIICTSLQTDNHASTSPHSFYRPDGLPAAQPAASKHWRHNINLHNNNNINNGSMCSTIRSKIQRCRIRKRHSIFRGLSHLCPCRSWLLHGSVFHVSKPQASTSLRYFHASPEFAATLAPSPARNWSLAVPYQTTGHGPALLPEPDRKHAHLSSAQRIRSTTAITMSTFNR